MTITQNEQLIINLGKGTRIFEKDHVKKALEAYEVKTGCANYERDNVLMSEMEQNVADYIIGVDPYKKDGKDFSYEVSVLKHKHFVEQMKQRAKEYDNIKNVEETDPIVEQVRQKLLDRSTAGLKKYNTTIWDNTDENYIKHLQDELLDGANYCEQMLRLGEFTTKICKILDVETNYYTIGELIAKEYNKLKNDRTNK